MNAQNQSQQSILKSHPIPGDDGQAPGRITLREWRKDEEWVTHFFNLQDGGFYYGRYFTDLGEAEANFQVRVKEYLGVPEKLPSSFESEEPIEIPERILEGIDAVRALATINMFDVQIVRAQASALEYLETALWIEANPETYYDGIIRGFAALSN
ncbi:MAG: DUF5049 domain-containing protein (plasmid) [Microcoleus anatoxicus]|uniref:DUF5049 domain-containing protein n=1 Tax=Microcoleus anatoxicus TaxID=2705319 RepID=UPI003671DFB7